MIEISFFAILSSLFLSTDHGKGVILEIFFWPLSHFEGSPSTRNRVKSDRFYLLRWALSEKLPQDLAGLESKSYLLFSHNVKEIRRLVIKMYF